jgi:hypothetical protein
VVVLVVLVVVELRMGVVGTGTARLVLSIR